MSYNTSLAVRAFRRVPLVALIAAGLVYAPAAQARDYTRSCTATISFGPSGGTYVRHSFTGRGTVSTYRPNTAREKARRNIDECLNANFANPNGLRPNACTTSNQVYNYPFRRLHQELALQACNANRGRPNLRLGISVTYDGDKGCTLDNNSWGRTLLSNYQVNCATQNYEPGTNRPGMDYHDYDTRGGWQGCQARCESEARCEAWVYKNPTTPGGLGHCWLKDGVPTAQPQRNFTSGVKIQLH